MGKSERWKSFLHYLPYSKEDEKMGMVCTTVGRSEIAPHAVYPPRKNEHPAPFRPVAEGRILTQFQLVYITAGEGVFASGGAVRRVSPGSMLLILPGMKHSYSPACETGWIEHWVGFSGSYFAGLVREGILSAERVLFEIGLQDVILTTFNSIFDEVRAQRPLYQLKACVGIMGLIGETLSRERRLHQPTAYEEIVGKAKCLMESNIYGDINLTSISEQIGLCSSRLNEIFKTYTSMTPYQYYIHIKVHRAESLLEEGMTVKETAYRLGFDDQYYFSRLFKNKTGVSPSDWKKLLYTAAEG